MSPALSIITPSLNQAVFLHESIRSVLDQRYAPCEHIIIDGGSTDGTLRILEQYPHLRWISEPDRGQGHAVNKGFTMASGDIIGWLNADDRYCSGAFEKVANAFMDADVMVVCGDGFRIDENGEITGTLTSGAAAPDHLIRYWRWKYEFVHPSFFFRKSVFDAAGMIDETLTYAMDVDFIIRLGLRYSFTYLHEPLACLRFHPGSKTGRDTRSFIPPHIREMQKVSYRYWGRPWEFRYYRYGASFLGAVCLSVWKNLTLARGSKLRGFLFTGR